MERVVGREKLSLFTRKILTPGVACTLWNNRRQREDGETQEHIQHEQTYCKENRVP